MRAISIGSGPRYPPRDSRCGHRNSQLERADCSGNYSFPPPPYRSTSVDCMAHNPDDDEHVAHPVPGRPTIPYGFSFDDDAFSDTEDIGVPEFSPAKLREELAKNMNGGSHGNGAAIDSWSGGFDMDHIVAKIGYSVDPDASVSTFDIDGGHESPPSTPLSPAQVSRSPSSPHRMMSQSSSHQDSLYEVPLSTELSRVSLDDDPPSPPAPHHEEPEDTVTEFPAVQIDLSGPEALATEVRLGTPSSDGTRFTEGDQSLPRQQAASMEEVRKAHPSPLEIPPLTAAAASTSALPLTSSVSVPTPTSAGLVESPTPTTRHRPSRSVGPSMLDKVISKTRPTHLPPKPRTEDRKHQQVWEEMMKRSRAAGECTRSAGRLSSTSRTNVH